jgi:hypothetical protein
MSKKRYKVGQEKIEGYTRFIVTKQFDQFCGTFLVFKVQQGPLKTIGWVLENNKLFKYITFEAFFDYHNKQYHS